MIIIILIINQFLKKWKIYIIIFIKIMSKLDELYKQKEAILKELNKLPNKERDYKEYYKIY